MSEFELTPEEMKLFLEEAEEQLAVMEETLIQLEQDPGNTEMVQTIFRAAHTLKGGAATAGFANIAKLTHAMESLLDLVRQGQRQLSEEMTDQLLESVDWLKEALASVMSGSEADQDFGEMIARLEQAALGDGGRQPEAQQTKQQQTKRMKDAAELPREWSQMLSQHPDRADSARLLRIEISREAPMPSVRAYQAIMLLEEQGEILRTSPTIQAIEEELKPCHQVEVLLYTEADLEKLKQQILAIPDVIAAEWLKVQVSLPQEETQVQTSNQEDAREKTASRQSPLGLGQTVRVDVRVLDRLMNLVGELVIERTRLARLHSEEMDEDTAREELEQVSGQLNRITTDLQDAIMKVRMVPLESIFKKFPRMMRDLSKQLNKPVDFFMTGEETELDRSVIEHISDPLIHMLRNAIDHGIETPEERRAAGKPETGCVKLTASHRENHIYITVEDDGKGLDPVKLRRTALQKGIITEEQAGRLSYQESLELIFAPGFTTADEVSSVSGRGVGMDVVKRNLEKVNGAVTVHSQPGKGSRFVIKLPLTLAILHALMVEVAGVVYALPLSNVVEAVRVRQAETDLANGWRMIPVRGEMVPLLNPGEIWGEENRAEWRVDQANQVVILQSGTAPLGLIVDRLLGEQEIVMKSMGKVIGEVAGVSGASILGDGSVALIIDVAGLTSSVRQLARRP